VIFKTNFGLKVRAVRRNRAMSGCLGIDTARVDMTIFAFGCGLAGIAGAVLAPIKSVSTTMGFPYAVDSYMVLVLGGVGSLWGVLTGGVLIGEAETILSFIFNNVIGRLLVFLFIVIVIRVVPRGIPVFTRQVSMLWNLCAEHRPHLGICGHSQSRPGGLFRHRGLFRRAVAQDQLRAHSPHPLRGEIS